MPFLSLTRLRIRSLRFMPGFGFYALKTTAQTRRAEGFLKGALLPDRKWTFWTMTLWRDESDMRAFMKSGAHAQAMPKLMYWCDEASVVHWHQDEEALPDWAEADARMRETGRPSRVLYPTPQHLELRYREPRTTRSTPISPRAG